VADFALVEAAADEVDDIVGGLAGGFVDQKEAIELGDHGMRAVGYRLQAEGYEVVELFSHE
jgi:hypothetical protein